MQLSNTLKKGKLSPIVNYNGFESAFENLPKKASLLVRRELMKKFGWSISTFYYKRVGDSPLRENEVPVIQEIFARFGLNAFTGEKI